VKREDLLHPQLQGNKWRKLKYNMAHFEANRAAFEGKILTFGGAHSNHIYATAAAGKLFGAQTIGVIRGERVEPLNPTLAYAEQSGMHLHFVSRTDYRLRGTAEMSASLHEQFGAFFEVPEGGSNVRALQGVAELAQELPDCDYVAVAAGTGATAAGLVLGGQVFDKKYETLVFSVLKGGDFLNKDIQDFITKNDFAPSKHESADYHLFTEYHGGGYAKNSTALQNFMHDFTQKTNIPIEHVYTGKLFWALFDLIEKDYFPPKTNIIAIHTGGLRSNSI
jgi:1-aminocyclopropane-1-carboxylate deaminase